MATRNLVSFNLTLVNGGLPELQVHCTSASPYHLPLIVKAGDADSTPGFTCDNNLTLSQGSWRAEDAEKGNLNFILTSKTFSSNDNIVDETLIYPLNPQGEIISFNIDNVESYAH